MTRRWTLADMRACNRAHGQHWFDHGTMKFFASRVERGVYQGPGGIFFVSSEQFEGSQVTFPRKYSVRRFNPRKCTVGTAGEFQAYAGKFAAREAAKRLARGG